MKKSLLRYEDPLGFGYATWKYLSRSSVYLQYLYVQPAYRFQGHGTRILAAFEQCLRDQGVERITLHAKIVSEIGVLHLRQWYEQRGYQPEKAAKMTKTLVTPKL